MYTIRACALRCSHLSKLHAARGRRRCSWASFSSQAEQFLAKSKNRIPLPRCLNSLPVSSSTQSRDIRDFNLRIKQLGSSGKVEEARKLFDSMPYRDAFSYSSIINVYLRDNDLPRAEELFRAMPRGNIVAESAMINGYVKAGRMCDARKLFDEMGERNVYSWTSLVSGYFQRGQVDEGWRLFDQMPEKNIVSWTTIVVGYARNGLICRAREVFDLMPEKNIISWTAMIKSYIENGLIDDAERLFNEMPEKNSYSWNIMIQGLMDFNRVGEAIRLFNTMPQRNSVSWTTMVTGLARNGMTKHAREHFEKMPHKDIGSWNAMITAYVDEGLMLEARELFNLMPYRNLLTWNAMINGYAKHSPAGEALLLLVHMFRSEYKPNEMTITSALSSCGSLVEVMQSHALAIPLGFEHDTLLANALINMYSRSGDLLSAALVFEYLGTKDIISWTAMILSYAQHGYGHHALSVFAQMLRAGATPDEITFLGVLSACSHAGLVQKGRMLFNSMTTPYGLEPQTEHFCCLIDILGRSAQVEEALEVFCKMPEHKRDSAVLGALLGTCRLNGDDRLANHIGEKLIKLEPTTAGPYILLANIFAACGNWNELAQVRKKMKEKNVKKVPGFSQIAVNGRTHVFFAGDRSHSKMNEIYGFLQQNLIPQMVEFGCAKERQSTLH